MNGSDESPALSVVTSSRNDDHGGNPLARTQLFIDGLADQADRIGLSLELVMVEWNPPPDKAPLAEALRWPSSRRFRPSIITVPREIHETYPNSKGLPLFQMIAKNVGIRRSHGEYVLATNIDILLSDELFTYLATSLKPNAMYRTDRRDVQVPFDRQPPPTPAECRRLPALRQHGLKRVVYPAGAAPRGASSRLRLAELPRLSIAAWDRLHLPALHTSGSGDFTLTSRDVWMAIGGYAEWPFYSWHIDGLPLFQAYAAGVEIVNLEDPMVAIHFEHSTGSGWTPEGAGALFGRLDAAGVPYLSTREYRKLARRIVHSGLGFQPLNGPDWGLAEHDLEMARV